MSQKDKNFEICNSKFGVGCPRFSSLFQERINSGVTLFPSRTSEFRGILNNILSDSGVAALNDRCPEPISVARPHPLFQSH